MKTFADLGVDDDIVQTLASHDITSPFPIQALAIPLALIMAFSRPVELPEQESQLTSQGLRPVTPFSRRVRGHQPRVAKHHPDRVPAASPERAARTRRFQLINDAYYALSDPGRRRRLDARFTPRWPRGRPREPAGHAQR